MITELTQIDHYYEMLVEKNSQYEGIFYVGVKTTGVFCRPTCPAKKPLKKNCEFFGDAQEALLASYRPCKRCKPLSAPSYLSPDVQRLVDAVETNPERKWTDKDFDSLAIHPNTARRQFKKYFGMTFIEYSRARRLGLAFKHIRQGEPIIDAQLEAGFDSGNGFRDAFARIMGELPSNSKEKRALYSTWLETKLGAMLAISDHEQLYLLEFVDRRGLETEIMMLRKRLNAVIIPQQTEIIQLLTQELSEYFNGQRMIFTVPLAMVGSPFQQQVWQQLLQINTGETYSYKQLAQAIGNDKASRAVANANGKNQLSILIPCHRVINSDGTLGGYGGGLERKKWLLALEQKMAQSLSEPSTVPIASAR
ncbi:bifunctional transcriptional activator/DNA repair enzyme AdaA [Enterococcus sp.]|uniref:bifunctional transcriptional activator/DNA repair enzyme AdaA n=1 Tax=Enterococcus sp. TaxID=35783 RepID=UPI0028AA6091|nr:trifunctional transcriptional activator/DNA repair protein Ada/methylated-DNA--[protein]-cysteine S-methyltransferase [Enterococcus sp.]